MNRIMSLKVFAVVLAAGSFGFAGSASAYDDDRGDAAVGIIGTVIGSAIEAEAAKDEARDHERHCRRLARKCEEGQGWACEKQDAECGD